MSEEVGKERVLEINGEATVDVVMEGVTKTAMTMTAEAGLFTW